MTDTWRVGAVMFAGGGGDRLAWPRSVEEATGDLAKRSRGEGPRDRAHVGGAPCWPARTPEPRDMFAVTCAQAAADAYATMPPPQKRAP